MPSPWLQHLERRVEALEPLPAPAGHDPVLLQVRELFVELYRLVWSLQRGVPAGERRLTSRCASTAARSVGCPTSASRAPGTATTPAASR